MSVSTISLIESLLLHDRPASWWGLDTADPTVDDAVFGSSQQGYTLTAIGTPSNAASLHTRGDTGASGCRDFNGTTGGYWTAGSVTTEPEGPPAFHASNSSTATSANATILSPGGIAVGDLLIVVLLHDTDTATISSAPAGWTAEAAVLNSGAHAAIVYTKVAVQADTVPQEYTWVWSTSDDLVTAILVYRGCDPDVSGLVFDFGIQQTSPDTFHSTTTETHPDQARQVVIWGYRASGTVIPEPTNMTDRLNVTQNLLKLRVVDYTAETSGSGFKTATTEETAGSSLTAVLITFGAPRKVLNDALDTITGNLTIGCLINPDTVAAGSRTIIRKEGSWLFQVDAATVKFFYHDGTSWRSHSASGSLSAGTTYRLWVRDDGTNISFWRNGTKSTVARFNALPYATNTNRVTIAHFWNGSTASEFFDGRIDEVAVFPAALTDSMIEAHEQAATLGTFGTVMVPAAPSRYPRGKLELAVDSNPTDACYAFTDVTADTRREIGITYSATRNDPLDRMQAGTSSFTLDNLTRTYDSLLPRRVVRFRVQVATDGPVIQRFLHFTDAPKHSRPGEGVDATVSLSATDVFTALALNKVQDTLVRPKELAHERLDAVLSGVDGIRYTLDTGHHLLEGVDLQGVSRLEHCQAVAESDGGIFFGNALGYAEFQGNQYRALNSQTVEATYGWKGTTATYPAGPFQPEVDLSRLYTSAAVTPATGEVQRADNEAAAAQFFPVTKEVTTLHASDIDALAMAHHIVNVYSTPLQRIPELVLYPGKHSFTAGAMWNAVLAHKISSRVSTIEDPPGGAQVAREHFVEGISERVTGSEWVVTLSLSPTELEGDYFVIGVDEIGDIEKVIGW